MKNIFYHGTKISPETVLSEGLKPIDIQDSLLMLSEKYNLDLKTIYEICYEHINRKKECLNVYFTNDYKEAKWYSESGSNFITNSQL